MITIVAGGLDPDAARWALRLNDLGRARVALAPPPGVDSVGALANAVLEAMGKLASENGRVRSEAEAVELLLAWLRGHEVNRLILVHADWIPASVLTGLAGMLALPGVELIALVDPGGERVLDAWADHSVSWLTFVEQLTRDDVTPERQPDRVADQADAITVLGIPPDSQDLLDDERLGAVGLLAQADLTARVQRDGRTEGAVAHGVALVLRPIPPGPDRLEAARGAARALAPSGWRLAGDRMALASGEPAALASPWSSLRTSIYPDGAAAVGLLGAGLWAADVAGLRVREVSTDGATVSHQGRTLSVPIGARAYIAAQRLLAATEGVDAPLVTRRGHPYTAIGLAMLASVTLAEVGASVRPRSLLEPRMPSVRWLRAAGFGLWKGDATVSLRCRPRCAHGIPAELVVEGVTLEHSQRLCKAPGPPERRPTEVRPSSAGYRLEELERTTAGVRIAVRRPDGPAGELVGVTIDESPIWLQVGTGRVPSVDVVAAVVAAERRRHTGA